MNAILFVALGGACGAVARYLTSLAALRLAPGASFPWATTAVNLLGCFGIGVLHVWATERGWLPAPWRLALMTGFLGSFTTYSTFANESWLLLADERRLLGFGFVALHLLGGLALVALGHAAARAL